MPEPSRIPRPFADSGDKNTIPESGGDLGFASWQEGFPAITSQPFSEGGVAPKRADFNGIFNALSAATVWQQQGGLYAYSNTVDYEVGNVVLYSGNLYKCLVANGPNSAVKAPTDTTVWDAIATASGYLPLSGGTLLNGTDSLLLRPGLIELSASLPFIDFHHGNSSADHTARIINDQDGRLVVSVQNDTNTQTKNLNLNIDGTLTWDGNNVITSAGGAFGGDLSNSRTTTSFRIMGGASVNTGARLTLAPEGNSSYPGEFWLVARASGVEKQLIGKPDGKLTWGGEDVLISPGYYFGSFDNKSIPNNAITNLGSFTLAKGLYFVNLTVAFANNTAGYRQIHISSSATGSSIDRYCSYIFAPCPSTGTGKLFTILRVTAESATYYFNVYQNSGAALNTTLAGYQYMKIRNY